MSEFKPCPFCGEAPNIKVSENGTEFAQCLTAGCMMRFFWPTLANWNRRASPPAEATVRPNSQEWGNITGAVAYHLIERHSENWADAELMMNEWAAAQRSPPDARNAALEEAAKVCAKMAVDFPCEESYQRGFFAACEQCSNAIRALIQPAEREG